MGITIQVKDQVPGNPAEQCGTLFQQAVDSQLVSVNVPQCGNATFVPPSELDSNKVCSDGFVLHTSSTDSLQYCCELIF